MGMVRPTALTVNAFDATSVHTFYFTSSGGNQITSNKIVIRNNASNSVVYTHTVTSYILNQSVPAGTLQNGVYYNYSFFTYDKDGNESPESNIIAFYCYTTPTLTFTNIPSSKVVTNGTYTFDVQYAQSESELLDYAYVVLYNNSETVAQTGSNQYNTSAPPFTLQQTFSGMENNTSYYIEAFGVTVNGTEFNTGKISFSVVIQSPEIFSQLTLEDKCKSGYTQVTSNVVLVDGTSNPTPPEYINNNTAVYVDNMTNYVEWSQGYSVPDNWVIKIFMSPYSLGTFFTMNYNGDTKNRYDIKWVREIPYGETVGKDCFELVGYLNGVQTVLAKSNTVDIMNNTSECVVWIKKVGTVFTLTLAVTSQTSNHIYWNGSSNVVYNRITNLQYKNEKYKQGTQFTPTYGNMDSILEFTDTKLTNGIFEHINITKDTSVTFNTNIPTWDYYTILNCTFDGNINGGNVNILLTQLSSIKIKRRAIGETSWVSLTNIPISSYSDLQNLTYQDSLCAAGITYQWALVPVLTGGIEGNYVTATLTTSRDGVFVSDGSTIFKLHNGVIYGQTVQNKRIGVLQPIGLQYPVIIQNSDVNYKTGTIQGNLYGYNFDSTLTIDRNDVVKETEDFVQYMNNGSAKMVYDWNGNIYMIRELVSPTIDYVSAYGGGITLLGISWVEQGAYNNQLALYNNGFINTAS